MGGAAGRHTRPRRATRPPRACGAAPYPYPVCLIPISFPTCTFRLTEKNSVSSLARRERVLGQGGASEVNGGTAEGLLGELELELGRLLGDDVEDADSLLDDLGAWVLGTCCLVGFRRARCALQLVRVHVPLHTHRYHRRGEQ
jgi:hypothetical protein